LRIDFNAGRNSHILARGLITTWVEDIFNFQSENALLLGKVSTSNNTIEPFLAPAQNISVKRETLMLADTLNVLPQAAIIFQSETSPASFKRIPFCFSTFQVAAGELFST